MQDILNILIIYWKPIVGLVFTIIGFILLLIKKKPVDDIVYLVYRNAIDAVNWVEEKSKNDPCLKGDFKLVSAIQYVKNVLSDRFPDLPIDDYEDLITKVIELLLSTPQKKKD